MVRYFWFLPWLKTWICLVYSSYIYIYIYIHVYYTNPSTLMNTPIKTDAFFSGKRRLFQNMANLIGGIFLLSRLGAVCMYVCRLIS